MPKYAVSIGRCRRALSAASPASLVLLLLIGACSGNGEQNLARYGALQPGTTYNYTGVSNTITSVDGWRTRFTDSQGREGSRVALFLSEDPRNPMQVDSAQLASLWPLRVGNETSLEVQRGPEVWTYEFRVTGTQKVTVPAGEFDTFVVQAVESPRLVRDPASAFTAMYTWWYSPGVRNVVKFRTSYLAGPATGRQIESELESIEYSTN
jgi:hypothetical protein